MLLFQCLCKQKVHSAATFVSEMISVSVSVLFEHFQYILIYSLLGYTMYNSLDWFDWIEYKEI